MKEFKSQGWFRIKGRGWVATTTADEDYDRDSILQEMSKRSIMIDGEMFNVKGVETFAIPKISKGSPIGLLVKEVEET